MAKEHGGSDAADPGTVQYAHEGILAEADHTYHRDKAAAVLNRYPQFFLQKSRITQNAGDTHKMRISGDFQAVTWYNGGMKDQTLTAEKLNAMPKEMIIMMLLQQSESFHVLSEQSALIQKQNEALIRQVEDLKEQLAIMNSRLFGRKSEKSTDVSGQLSFDMEDSAPVFNEAEALVEGGFPEEPEAAEVVVSRRVKRPKGKRDIDLKDIKTDREDHYLTEEELNRKFPDGWKQLEDEVYKELKRIPESFEVVEHHIGVYAGLGEGDTVIRGHSPNRLLSHSILTPSLAAAVFTAKYINAVPLNRISELYSFGGINISRQVMAGWVIRLHEYYLGPVHERMKEELFRSHVIHCDETPFRMTGEKDEGDPKSKDYMWVYHSSGKNRGHPVYLYEYDNGSRAAAIPEAFLNGYQGVLVTDGYESYHTLAKRKSGDLKVAGCWVHNKRKVHEIVQAAGKNKTLTPGQKIAQEAEKRIQAIFHTDNMYSSSSNEERLEHRQQSVKPLVDAYFTWVKMTMEKPDLDKSSALCSALNYSINQEPYLRVFLDDPEVPMTNNDAERSIRKFCVGKHSWHIIESKKGAKASAMMYSLAETSRANGLNPYKYFEYLMEQLKEYPRNDIPKDKLEELMPWSETLPEYCRRPKKEENK